MDLLLSIISTLVKRRGRVLTASTIISLLCFPLAILLYANLRASVEELLPRSAPSIQALDTLHRRFGDNLQLALLVSGPSPEALHKFADKFAVDAQRIPSGAPRFIDFHPAEIQSFFDARKSLFIDLKDLQEAEKRVQTRIDWELNRDSEKSLGLDDDSGGPAPEVNLDDISKRYENQNNQVVSYSSGYYDSPDGRSLVMVFYPAKGVTGYGTGVAFRDELHQAAKTTAAAMGLNLTFQFTGDIESIIQEQRSLEADLINSSIIVLVFEAFVVLVYFRWVPALLVLAFPLGLGTLLTFAFAYLGIGSLNASSAFLGAIIIGNGVNPGIILLARFVEERRKGAERPGAVDIAVRETFEATLVASAAAALSYGALMVTTFRGYSHFGVMGAFGMAVCWIATYMVLPSAAVAIESRWPVRPRSEKHDGIGQKLFGIIGHFGTRRPALVVTVAAIATIAVTVIVVRFARDPFEYSTAKMRSSWASEPGGYMEIDRKCDAILKRVITPAVVLLDSQEEVETVAQKFRDLSDSKDPDLILGNVLTIQSLIPKDQDKKIEILERLTRKLSGKRLDSLPEDQRKKVKEILPDNPPKAFAIADLPIAVRRQVRETDGSEGKMILLFPRRGSDTIDGRVVARFAREIRSIPLPTNGVVAGSYLIFADMLTSIAHDGPLATVVAFLAVTLLSLWFARGSSGSIAVTLALGIGVLWTAGIAAIFSIRINFLNVIALPITFGIGVDYAVNVYGRYRQSSPSVESLAEAVQHSGPAVALCSATTVIGYSSLLFSRNGALFSFGLLSVVGEVACLVAALLVLPAMLSLRRSPSKLATAKAES